MQSSLFVVPRACPAPAVPAAGASAQLYHQLAQVDHVANAGVREALLATSRQYLHSCLEQAAELPCDLPEDIQGLPAWIYGNVAQVGRQYQRYLAARKAGEPRRYFSSKAHALYFLRAVAPTKLVDGAWLYGLLSHWQDARFSSLIRIYLEELGEGAPDKNHVLLYRQLLAANGCEDWDVLADEHYVQGAIQLALAHNAEHFLPELIGFNLGYEQLPLHLLITSYELKELGIDPYYFTLHVTVDNAATGHAQQALEGLHQAMPELGDKAEFYRRVINGYRLNSLGASTLSTIADFDLDEEVVAVLSRKSIAGKDMHSDFCRVAGRTVNDWLADPRQIPEFLANMEQKGWIKRHQDPQQSRFWQLIEGPRAQMFGVFSAYEQAVIYQWIAGDWHNPEAARRGTGLALPKRQMQAPAATRSLGATDFDSEERLLTHTLAQLHSRQARLDWLVPLLSPARHHSPVGLLATRMFSQLLGQA